MLIDLDKKYKTRDGRHAEVVFIDDSKDNVYCVQGFYLGNYRREIRASWTNTGKFTAECSGLLDLVEIKE
jgi:hypothetical protein